ncbi:IclR family transcriptional regulator C-terminal domain-containing protein [Pseudonocardia benzenivorans]|uniref:IclR family transcriptional regulator C-terminal domain-containing protein n=1 Tax=Pseudonocardia benzenivorans TaxID=228005 RepID=A0ABW3VII5_9PSEU
MGGLAKGLAIIEAFGPLRPALTVSQAATCSSTTPAAARRCLLTLADLGYVSYDGKYFRPTPRMMRLSTVYASTASLPVLAQPCLEAVHDQLDETASLAVLDGDEALFVARVEAARIVSAGVRVGSALPLHASATGRVLLAGMSDEELDERLRRARPQQTTPNTLLTVADIRDRVHKVRSEGVAYTDEELEYGMRTMAVPVSDATGRTQAAMAVSVFSARVSMERLQGEFLDVLRRQAGRLGSML